MFGNGTDGPRGTDEHSAVVDDDCRPARGASAADGAGQDHAVGPDVVTLLRDVSVRERVAAVELLLADLAHVSAVDLESKDLLDSIRSVERLRRYADSVSCRLLAEVETRKVTDTASGLQTATWLARHAHLPAAAAKRRVRIAKKLAEDLPSVSEALADGKLGLDQAGVLADAANPRIADQIDAATEDLCEAISGSTFGRWKKEVRSLADLLDQDGGHDPSNDIERNHLSLSMTGQTLVLRGELTGENALIAREALDKIADQLFMRYSRDNEVTPDIEIPNRKTLLALALVEAARRALGSRGGRAPHAEATLILTPSRLGDPAGFPFGPRSPSRSGGFSHANGFEFPAGRDFTAGPDLPVGFDWHPGVGSPVGVGSSTDSDTRDETWFTGAGPPTAPPPAPGSGRLGTGPPDARSEPRSWRGFTVRDEQGMTLPRRSWEVLMCDPALYPIVLDSLGVPVDMGRQVRLATQAQRRALAVRDGGCVFPGCEMPVRWTEAHHETEWRFGGLTDLKDLASLCRHHHRVAHRPGWSVEVLEDGTTRWTTPMGQVFAGQQHGRTVVHPTVSADTAEEMDE